jgi:hypothetical protein
MNLQPSRLSCRGGLFIALNGVGTCVGNAETDTGVDAHR